MYPLKAKVRMRPCACADDVNPFILRMLEGTFSLDVIQVNITLLLVTLADRHLELHAIILLSIKFQLYWIKKLY